MVICVYFCRTNQKTTNFITTLQRHLLTMKLVITTVAAAVAGIATLQAAPSHLIHQEDFTRAAESTVNGVVSVKSYATPRVRQNPYMQQGGDMFDDPFFEFFFGPQQRRQAPRRQVPQEAPKQQQTGLGSGVIISPDGYIVTNNHVIADAERLEVTLNDNRNYNATVVGADPDTDLALIKIDAPNLHVIPMGDSDSLKVGEWVLAVGNPFGFTSTVTSGIVSAKARNISAGSRGAGGIESYIQTDAAVNSGNSGGALVNLSGELVGINSAIYSQNGTYVGYSFAIPTSIVNKVVADLKQYGTVQRAYLGLTLRELTPEFIAEKKLDSNVVSGMYVVEVADRSAAREAGLKPGDIIQTVGNYVVTSLASLQEAVARYSPGDTVTIGFKRDGKPMQAQVTLRNRRGDTAVTRQASVTDLGCAFMAVPKQQLEQLELSYGVQVSGLEDGRFKQAGIRDGFIILTVNGQRITSPEDMDKLYHAIMKGNDDKVMYIKGVYPTGKQNFYAVPLAD